jgi:taurine dioxygenase
LCRDLSAIIAYRPQGEGMAAQIEIRPTGTALGADARGVDFGDLDEWTLDRIRTALGEHLVLRFRGIELSDADYMALGRQLGEIVPPEAHTRTADMTTADFPEMSVVSNIVEGGVAKGEAGDGELLWHNDHGVMERPAAHTMLLAREVPAQDGDTSFVNMCRAYKALYLGRRFGSYIPPLPLEESEALLDALWAAATREELTWTQSWHVGDLVIWDNRCTMHRRESFAGHGLRRMHRPMTLGERPV